MKITSILLLSTGWFMASCSPEVQYAEVDLLVDQSASKVEVRFDGELFTNYMFESGIEKPVLYPVLAPGGVPVSRGFPLEPREKERVDHPHHLGIWFNYGDVNDLDFWNNSFAIPAERKKDYGRIIHQEITQAKVKGNQGILEVQTAWWGPDTDQAELLLNEQTTYIFQATDQVRRVDRITRLTATGGQVVFQDNKEGLLAIRVDRAFELPADKPQIYTDAAGIPTDVPVLDNEGVTGWYRNSNGDEGNDAWGKNAAWVKLSATKGGKPYSIVIFDHPENLNYPACWHARGYGLFSVNNMGRHAYNKELDQFTMTLEKGESVTFRHRIVVASGNLTDEEIEAIAADFTKE